MSHKKKHGSPDAKDAGSPLLKHVDELVESLRDLTAPAIRDGEVTAVHHARVATRRLKAAFDLLEPLAGEAPVKKFGRSLKKLRKRLGPLRDLDVMTEHVDELSGDAEVAAQHAPALSWLRSQLVERRKCAAEAIREDAPPSKVLSKLGRWWGLRDELAKPCEQAGGPLINSLRTQLAAFARSAAQLTQPAEGGERLDPHEIRIAGKALRYTLEMARANGVPLSDAVFKSFKQLQDVLGLWHDYVVLTETMLAIASEEDLALHDAAAQRGVLALASFTLERVEEELKKFADLWREEGAALGDAIHASIAAPIESTVSSPVTSPKADRDPTGSDGTSPSAALSRDVPPPT